MSIRKYLCDAIVIFLLLVVYRYVFLHMIHDILTEMKKQLFEMASGKISLTAFMMEASKSGIPRPQLRLELALAQFHKFI